MNTEIENANIPMQEDSPILTNLAKDRVCERYGLVGTKAIECAAHAWRFGLRQENFRYGLRSMEWK